MTLPNVGCEKKKGPLSESAGRFCGTFLSAGLWKIIQGEEGMFKKLGMRNIKVQ